MIYFPSPPLKDTTNSTHNHRVKSWPTSPRNLSNMNRLYCPPPSHPATLNSSPSASDGFPSRTSRARSANNPLISRFAPEPRGFRSAGSSDRVSYQDRRFYELTPMRVVTNVTSFPCEVGSPSSASSTSSSHIPLTPITTHDESQHGLPWIMEEMDVDSDGGGGTCHDCPLSYPYTTPTRWWSNSDSTPFAHPSHANYPYDSHESLYPGRSTLHAQPEPQSHDAFIPAEAPQNSHNEFRPLSYPSPDSPYSPSDISSSPTCSSSAFNLSRSDIVSQPASSPVYSHQPRPIKLHQPRPIRPIPIISLSDISSTNPTISSQHSVPLDVSRPCKGETIIAKDDTLSTLSLLCQPVPQSVLSQFQPPDTNRVNEAENLLSPDPQFRAPSFAYDSYDVVDSLYDRVPATSAATCGCGCMDSDVYKPAGASTFYYSF